MSEYVDVTQLWKCDTCFYGNDTGGCTWKIGCEHGENYRPAYNKLEKVDVAPVNYAQWKWDHADVYICTNCGEKCHVKEIMEEPVWGWCPSCGATINGRC